MRMLFMTDDANNNYIWVRNRGLIQYRPLKVKSVITISKVKAHQAHCKTSKKYNGVLTVPAATTARHKEEHGCNKMDF